MRLGTLLAREASERRTKSRTFCEKLKLFFISLEAFV